MKKDLNKITCNNLTINKELIIVSDGDDERIKIGPNKISAEKDVKIKSSNVNFEQIKTGITGYTELKIHEGFTSVGAVNDFFAKQSKGKWLLDCSLVFDGIKDGKNKGIDDYDGIVQFPIKLLYDGSVKMMTVECSTFEAGADLNNNRTFVWDNGWKIYDVNKNKTYTLTSSYWIFVFTAVKLPEEN